MFRNFVVAVCIVCASFSLLPAALRAEDTEVDKRLAEIEKLRQEITCINLINGLNLTEEQLKSLIAIASEVQARKNEMKARTQKLVEETAQAFADLKVNLLAKGTFIPEDVAGKAGSLDARLKELHSKTEPEFETYARKVCEILTDAQKEVISTFEPCLLPPKSQKSPVLVGQSEERDIAVRVLRRVRELPEKRFQEKKDEFLNKKFVHLKKHGAELTEEERAAERDRLFKVIDRVRAMDDEQFELEKSELAKEFEVKDRVHELREELDNLVDERDPERVEKGIARYFLKSSMLGILEDRLKNLTSFKAATQVDLDETPPTDRPT